MATPWLFRMRFLDLLFAHWPVPAEALRRLLPDDPALELDEFDGTGWLGVVPFTMSDLSVRGLPAIPRLSTFPEVNLRTYVRYRGLPGVWFLSLDVRSRPGVLAGRIGFHLPYHDAEMVAVQRAHGVAIRSVRRGRGPDARFVARYSPVGPVMEAVADSFETWATVRMRQFAADRKGRIWRSEIDHGPWPLQPAEATIDAAELVAAAGLALPDAAPIVQFSRCLDVHAWLPVRA